MLPLPPFKEEGIAAFFFNYFVIYLLLFYIKFLPPTQEALLTHEVWYK